MWVLTWSETGHRLTREPSVVPLGFGRHVLVEREDFGKRVSLQHWVRREVTALKPTTVRFVPSEATSPDELAIAALHLYAYETAAE